MKKREVETEALPPWRKIETVSLVTLDAQARPVLQVLLEGRVVPVGISEPMLSALRARLS